MARSALIVLLTVLAFGILVPWYKGVSLLDARMVVAYGLLALLFAAPASAESTRGTTAFGEVLRKLAVIVGFGWGVTVVTMISAVLTLSIVYGHGTFLAPPVQLCAAVLCGSLTGAAAVASMSAVLARRLSAGSVKAILRALFLLALLAFVFDSRLPDSWQIFLAEHATRRAITKLAWEASAVIAIASILLMVVLMRMPTPLGPSANIPMAENPTEEEDEQRRQH